MPPPSLSPERAKVAKFYSARSKTIPPLPWQTFALPFSPADWAAAIERLLSDDALWSDMSQAALDHARRQYGHDAGVRTMAALLDGVLRPTLPKAAPSEPAAPALATFDDAAQRLTLHFEVQHHGAPDPALWLAGSSRISSCRR